MPWRQPKALIVNRKVSRLDEVDDHIPLYVHRLQAPPAADKLRKQTGLRPRPPTALFG
jgi:hypothetical protein